MFNVRSKIECAVAYSILREAEYMAHAPKEKVDELKREVRKYTHRPVDDRRCVHEDGYGYYTLLYPLPDDLKTIEDAEEYFDEYERVECRPSAYDCTGQHFTTGHKIFWRHGRLYVFHRFAIDC